MIGSTMTKSKFAIIVALILLNVTLLGCQSTSSTLLSRSEGGQLFGNSNGKQAFGHGAKPFKGIPVTVRIPTHVDITIVETLYFNQDSMSPICMTRRTMNAIPEYKYSDKIISVDPKRPVAGKLDYNLGFQNENSEPRDRQFFSKIDYSVEDKTISTIDEILKSVIPNLVPKQSKAVTTSSGGTSNDRISENKLAEIDRVVAWRRFDINSPDFEHQLTAFIEHHLNNCHSCSNNVMNGTVCQPTWPIAPEEIDH